MSLFRVNASGSWIHSAKVSRACEFEEVNKALDKWYLLALFKKTFILEALSLLRKPSSLLSNWVNETLKALMVG